MTQKLYTKFIVTADWHLRATRPRCRTDNDWIKTQDDHLYKLGCLARDNGCDVIVVGDIFENNKEASDEIVFLVQKLASFLYQYKQRLFILAGNHDLPYHSHDYLSKSAIGVLLGSKNIYDLTQVTATFSNLKVSARHFAQPQDISAAVVFEHRLVFPDAQSVPYNVDAFTAETLCRAYPQASFIFTGDYHRNFVYKSSTGQLLINSGCLIRQASDMKDYVCGVYLVDLGKGQHTFLYLNESKDLVSTEHIDEKAKKDGRIEAFVQSLHGQDKLSFDFVDNVNNELDNNMLISVGVKTRVREIMNDI